MAIRSRNWSQNFSSRVDTSDQSRHPSGSICLQLDVDVGVGVDYFGHDVVSIARGATGREGKHVIAVLTEQRVEPRAVPTALVSQLAHR